MHKPTASTRAHKIQGLSYRDAAHYLRAGALQFHSLPPLSLYVHMPWCIRKCPYCDFNSYATRDKTLGANEQKAYVDALIADLDAALPLVYGRTVHSIFLGGGTPSLFEPTHIAHLLGQIRARVPLVAECEITLEANPGTFESERFKAFAAAGVNRLSLGVQSFNDRHLHALGRVHDAAQARAAIEEALRHFTTFNLDLMYALPGQTLEESQQDLEAALEFSPPHLSLYHLTLEPNTYWGKYPPQTLPTEDLGYEMLQRGIARVAQGGLERYEISAFAKSGHRARHNLNYWQFGDYLGIGAAAHSKLSFAHRVSRQVRLHEPNTYMQRASAGSALASDSEVALPDLPFEFMLNALRLKEGVPLHLFSQRTALPLATIEPALQVAVNKGLLDAGDRSVLKASTRGFDFLSDLQMLFLVDK